MNQKDKNSSSTILKKMRSFNLNRKKFNPFLTWESLNLSPCPPSPKAPICYPLMSSTNGNTKSMNQPKKMNSHTGKLD